VEDADRRQRHRRLAVEAEATNEHRAPQRGKPRRQLGDDRRRFVEQQALERLHGALVGEDVAPAVRRARADHVVERDVLAPTAVDRSRPRPPDDARVSRDEGLHTTPRPPRGVREELNPARGVEAQRGVEETQASFRFEILAGDAGLLEFPCDPGNEVDAG